ncbi:MAG: MFS transporter [Chloroflexi bacterium]|nr:MFS transporter [Chloroflexota bacterium]
MNRRSAFVLLTVMGTGVFLAGLELMITAVALPTIIVSLASNPGASAWLELRHASWIVNAYLLIHVATMPLAGRLSDLWGVRRLFLGALAVFTLGSFLAGASQTMDQLVIARAIQALGGGALVPVASAAASHLFEGHERARALGVIGALTFLGMAAGPFVGAAILAGARPADALLGLGLDPDGLVASIASPAWRWVFYVNVPIGLAALAVGWAATAGWDTPRTRARVDLAGATLFTVGLGLLLVGITLLGEQGGAVTGGGADPFLGPGAMIALGILAATAAVVVGFRRPEPFLDPRPFADRVFSSAALVSLLTGYGFATAIVGTAVFVDRVLYGGPAGQRLALGALAGATALGALASGLLVRRLSLRLVTVVGLGASIAGLAAMSTWDASVTPAVVAGAAALFGFGFGLTVTPRSTAAVEAAGRRRFGAASATVTVARMIGMAVGLAVLTAYGSTTVDRLNREIFSSPESFAALLPPELADRPFRDPLVVDFLETWAAEEAAETMVRLFAVAAAVTAVAIPPGLVLGRRTRMLSGDEVGGGPATSGGGDGGGAEPEPTLAL